MTIYSVILSKELEGTVIQEDDLYCGAVMGGSRDSTPCQPFGVWGAVLPHCGGHCVLSCGAEIQPFHRCQPISIYSTMAFQVSPCQSVFSF